MRKSFMGLCIALVVALLIGCVHASTSQSCKKTGKTTCSCRLDRWALRTSRKMDTGALEKVEVNIQKKNFN